MTSRRSLTGAIACVGVMVLATPMTAATATSAPPSPRSSTPTAANCLRALPGVGPTHASQLDERTRQVVLVRAKKKQTSANKITFWQQLGGCWTRTNKVAGRNGYAGWHRYPVDGSGMSPIGTYTLTDAGGRLPNPGTRLPYHYAPQSYSGFGYKMNSNPVQIFDYVVAVNFNRYVGKPPRDEGRPSRAIRNGGIWFHVNGAGPTRGCISVTQADMAWVLKWLDPDATPAIIMGPKKRLAR